MRSDDELGGREGEDNVKATQRDDDGFAFEPCSVEVWRWGRAIRLAIRSEDSVGKCIELSLDDAADLAQRLTATINADKRRIRDEPQA